MVLDNLNSLKYDAATINKLGVVRGTIQLITKHQLNGQASPKDIQRVDDLLTEVRVTYLKRELEYSSFDIHLILDLERALRNQWQALKLAYKEHDQDKQAVSQVIDLSNDCWDLAYNLVLQVQKLSEMKLDNHRDTIIIGSLIICTFVLLVIIIVYRMIHNILERDVITDPLTGLYNRHHFNKILVEQLALFDRYKADFTLTILDIDLFKKINDEFGHPEGDRVLSDVAKIIANNSRDMDFLFRLGGEEFAVISPKSTSEQTFHQAEKYRNLVQNLDLKINSNLTVSIGISQSFDGCTVEEIYKNTDVALYQAKSLGRNTTVKFNS